MEGPEREKLFSDPSINGDRWEEYEFQGYSLGLGLFENARVEDILSVYKKLGREERGMSNTRVRIQEILSGVQLHGRQYFDDEKIELLESCISDCNYQTNLKEAGEQIVSDLIYDKLVEMLRSVKPESSLLKHIWEEDGDISDYNEQLLKHPMMSINTVKTYDGKFFSDFCGVLMEIGGTVDLFASYKLNGHGIRVVYLDGELVLATSRARASAGRDLTRQLKWLLGDYNSSLKGLGLVEVRGEICLPLSKLEVARGFNPEIKSAFSGVSSLIRPSTTKEEVDLLEFKAYKAYSDNLSFKTKEDEYQFLEKCNFRTPEYGVFDINTLNEDIQGKIESVMSAFENEYEKYDIFCDGVVIEINDKNVAESLGDDGRAPLGSVAMKVGAWGQDVYDGFVQRIEWTKGKSKLSPVAIVSESPNSTEEGVLTQQGNRVSRVPLYEPCNILILEAYIGRPLKFKYGGEAGVVPLTQGGQLLTEAVATSYLEEN